ncbi:hypothetical protein PG985_006468 [Apiospora marii]|uniref:Amine oxidase domain-containing protein n=1 Tax=Apiospora marii TaxID=335849 RepID=A0ABR1S7W1_9PEZI
MGILGDADSGVGLPEERQRPGKSTLPNETQTTTNVAPHSQKQRRGGSGLSGTLAIQRVPMVLWEKKFRVGIIGAGVSGLFTAMTFDYLKENYNLDVDYEILEVNDEDRLGGRLYTYYFEDKTDNEGNEMPKVGPHDYYDVGAMRFPNIGLMNRTFALFEELGMQFNDQDSKENREKNPPNPGQLAPYHFLGKNTSLLYNDVRFVTGGKKVPTAEYFRIPGLPYLVEQSSPSDLFEFPIRYSIELYKVLGPRVFWNVLMKVDRYSVRQYLAQVVNYDYNTIEFLEMMNLATMETVGTTKVSASPSSKPSISMPKPDGGASREVRRRLRPASGTAYGNETRGGAAPALRRRLQLGHFGRHAAGGPPTPQPELGHQAGDPLAGLRRVLQDRRPLQEPLVDSQAWHRRRGSVQDGPAHPLLRLSPSSVGAFAFYGPGQFRNMHPSIVQSSGKHIIIGEAASSHHGWVVGSLESAVRGVYQFLCRHSDASRAAPDAAQAYMNDKIALPFGPLPAECDRPRDVVVPSGIESTTVPSPKGELARHQVMIEVIRLKQGADVVDPSRVSKEDVAPFLMVVDA